ncbi:helix-hairpin-helix domain-containing protein [Patescibacteria group bacterium]|nr:helix-hairpin-helix domain-containing protein [Patescibacteria group bacterium]
MPETEGEFQTLLKLYRVPLALGIGSVVCIVLAVVLLFRTLAATAPVEFIAPEASDSGRMGGKILVDVEGAVTAPGTVELPEGSRVGEAIAAAGGLLADADTGYIAGSMNRAARLTDGAKLYIPYVADETSHNIDPSVQGQGLSQNGSVAHLININTASSEELDVLPGVGPVTAGKIISGRPYQTLEELVAKKAMSQSLFDNLKEQLAL